MDLKNALFANEQRNIIELGMLAFVISVFSCINFRFIGAGTGMVALMIASLRSSIRFPEENAGRIITTDLRAPSSLPASIIFRLDNSLCNTPALP